MIGLFDQSKSPPLIRELPLNDSLARSGDITMMLTVMIMIMTI